MKKFITLFIMATLAVGTMMAKWQSSDTEATRLDGNAVYQVQMKTLRTDDGKIILTWLRSENTNGVYSYKLHLQVFDAEGDAMFGDEGIIVCDKRTRSWTTDYGLALASNGDILLAYTDIRNDPTEENAETYLYRYTQQGESVWDVDGILFPSEKIHANAFVVEDVAPIICTSGDNIYAAVSHTEYFMEEANEDNWSPSPWNPGQQMPDSVQVDETTWLIVALNDDGTAMGDSKSIVSKILTMNGTSDGCVYVVYNTENLGLEAQLLDNELNNQWPDPAVVETSSLSSGIYMPTPITAVDDEDILILSYEVLTDFYGYQVVNYVAPWGYSPEAVSLAGGIDGDAGGAQMGIKEDRAFVAWEYGYSSSETRMNVNMVDDQNNYLWEGDRMYGVTLETNSSWGYQPVKVIPVEDGWVVLYGNCTSWNGANFMVVKMNEVGDVIWSKQICEDNFKSSGFSVTYDENYAYIFYTQDPQYKASGDGGMYVMCVLIADEEPSSIDEVQTSNLVNSTEIFTIDGRRVDALQPGVNIVRTTDENGIVTTKKVMK